MDDQPGPAQENPPQLTAEQMTERITQLEAQLRTAQTAPPITLSLDQWQTLLDVTGRSVRAAAQREDAAAHQPKRVRNPALSYIGGPDVYFQHHVVPEGVKDFKEAPTPSKFTNKRSDARPFCKRVAAHFAQKPAAFQFTYTRIIFFCQLLTETVAGHWATQVLRSVTTPIANDYYCDDWEVFVRKFLELYGIPNEKEDAINKLFNLRQGSQPFYQWISEVERLKHVAGIDNEAALTCLKRNMTPSLYEEIYRLQTLPTTYDEWKTAALAKEHQQLEKLSFDRAHRGSGTGFGFRKPSNGFSRPSSHNPRDPNAMDVDAISQRNRAPPKQPARPQAAPSSSRPKGPVKDLSHIQCHKCEKYGHYMRDCRNKLSPERINALVQMALSLHQDDPEDESEGVILEEEETATDEASPDEDDYITSLAATMHDHSLDFQ